MARVDGVRGNACVSKMRQHSISDLKGEAQKEGAVLRPATTTTTEDGTKPSISVLFRSFGSIESEGHSITAAIL